MSTDSQLTSMNVSLPLTQKLFVREQATASGCSTPSEYVRRLIHADQERLRQVELDESLALLERSFEDIEAGRIQPAKEALRRIADELGVKLNR